jgi:hypothetical protein
MDMEQPSSNNNDDKEFSTQRSFPFSATGRSDYPPV